jgi:hypothetical protein
MRKFILACAALGCALLVYAQNGFAYQLMSQGCLAAGCHSMSSLHAGTIHSGLTCDKCHKTPDGGGDAYPPKCIACHPVDNPGTCSLVKIPSHPSIGCTPCHPDCKSTCPAAKVLGADDPRLAKLRDFRDKVLAKSALGKRMMNIYYNNADAINAALDKNPTLKAFSYKALESFMPVVESFM